MGTTTKSQPVVIDNRNKDASKQDAIILGQVYRRLDAAVKAARQADKAVEAGWLDVTLLPELRGTRDTSIVTRDRILDESWKVLVAMPKGTTSGHATPQTVGLEFMHRNINRDMKLRLSAKQARLYNKAAFSIG